MFAWFTPFCISNKRALTEREEKTVTDDERTQLPSSHLKMCIW